MPASLSSPGRRSFLQAAALLALVGSVKAQTPPDRLMLWPDGPPGGGGPAGPLRGWNAGVIHNVAAPFIDVFRPAAPNGAAVLIAAGGGYREISIRNEAEAAARWLADQGVTAFVLAYRLPGENWAQGPLAPLQDAQRALRLIRARAEVYGLDAGRVGVLGFSAGGHLLGMAATCPDTAAYGPTDAIDRQSARPDFAGLIYPVVTLKPPYDHTSSRLQLVGAHPLPQQSADWSVETHVDDACPPVFLTHATDDPIVDSRNTLIMEEACRSAGVPVEAHLFDSGGHGFALGRKGSPAAAWPLAYRRWLARLNIVPDLISAL